MKIYLNYTVFATIIALIFTSVSCNNDSSTFQSKQKDIAVRGTLLNEKIAELYSSFSELEEYFDYKQEYLRILTGNDSSVNYLFNGIGFNKNYSDSLAEIAYKASLVYRSYDILTDLSVGLEQSGIVQNIKFFYESINLNKLSEDDKLLLISIKEASESNKFERKDIILGVSMIMLRIIEPDFNNMQTVVEKYFNAYDQGLKKIPNSVFDPVKVKTLVNEPYTDNDILVSLYKLQLRSEAENKKDKIIADMNALLIATQKVNAVHAEIIKQKRDNDKIQNLINEIDFLLNFKEQK